ncbi:hypothetical protein T265_01697 [Opisthorchis viverrini]|uniref:Cytochrome c domain-containing protein n=1 Tax=Opisthorchis viverrini TaxID=6198 RepID=A0A075AIV0_OPIVI|nr:hypothetical protein T265_01697 [Opisthorchis viverrini]KER32269.1 hypothetical protein T265_01697 [Opisthorchis viverrini]
MASVQDGNNPPSEKCSLDELESKTALHVEIIIEMSSLFSNAYCDLLTLHTVKTVISRVRLVLRLTALIGPVKDAIAVGHPTLASIDCRTSSKVLFTTNSNCITCHAYLTTRFSHPVMPRGPQLTEQERGKILAYREAGMSCRMISSLIGRSKTVVNNFLNNPKSYGKLKPTGRKKSIAEEKVERLILSESTKGLSASHLKVVANLEVSVRRVQQLIRNFRHPATQVPRSTSSRPNLKTTQAINEVENEKVEVSYSPYVETYEAV